MSQWVELGLAYWVAQHCGGKPGLAEIRPPFRSAFDLDPTTARMTAKKIDSPHALLKARNELTNLIGLSYDDFVGNSSNIPLVKARVGSFVSFLIEADHPIEARGSVTGRSRGGLWYYLCEVYGTPRAHSSDAFDEGLGGKIQQLEGPWKAWAKRYSGTTEAKR